MFLTPRQQFQLRSSLDLPYDLSFDTELYYVSGLNSSEVSSFLRPDISDIDPYIRIDLQLGWQAHENLKLSVSVENMFDSGHTEFPDSSHLIASEIPRQYWLKATCTF
jgi:iron complex outermembrane receptor protein